MEPIKKQIHTQLEVAKTVQIPISSSSSGRRNLSSDSGSPTSVLQTHKGGMPVVATNLSMHTKRNVSRQRMSQGGRNRTSGGRKSVMSLQLEELRGFRELGFDFTEEDQKNLILVSIVPGLKRIGGNSEASERLLNDGIHRPYLSISWDVMEKNEAVTKPALRINWKVGEIGSDENEMMIKEEIKLWARSIASAVR